MTDDPRSTALTAALLDAALAKAGADAADAMAVDGTSLSIDVRDGALEQAERSEGIDIGLRVLIGQRQACVSASDTPPETLTEMAERAVAMAREAPEDPYHRPCRPRAARHRLGYAALDLDDPSAEPGTRQAGRRRARAEAAALAVAASEGAIGARPAMAAARYTWPPPTASPAGTRAPTAALYLRCHHRRGHRDGTRLVRRKPRLPDRADCPAEEIGRIAAERTLARAGARKPPTGAYPVLYRRTHRLRPDRPSRLAAINGSAIVRGASWAARRSAKQVLPAALSLIEDPHRARVAGSRLFDGEGLPTAAAPSSRTVCCKGWVLDLATARKLGLDSTANASARHRPPRPRPPSATSR